MKEPIDEAIVLDWTVAIEALDFHSVQELLDLQPDLLWTPLTPSSHLETDFSHFIERLQEFKLLGTSIRPLYALHHILFDYGIEGDEWVEDRNELIDFILKKSTVEELDTCLWGGEENTIMHLAYFLNRKELIQLFLDKGLNATKPNRLGHLPTDNDQPKLLINREKKDSGNKPSATSDRFRRLRELAESPNNVKNKSNNKERQNSTRRYFRPGHLEERKRRVLSEEEEAELKEKERQKRQKEVEQLAQRSAVKNNPLFKKFEGQQEESAQKKEQIQTKAADTSVKDKAKFLNAAEQVKRSSRVINILKDRSVVSTSVFRQQTSDTQPPKKVPSLRTLKAAKEPAIKKKEENVIEKEDIKNDTSTIASSTSTIASSTSTIASSTSTPSIQSMPEEEPVIQISEESKVNEPMIIIQDDDENITQLELDETSNHIPAIDVTTEIHIESPPPNESSDRNQTLPIQPPEFDLNLPPTAINDKRPKVDSNKSVLASGRKITIVKKNGNVKKIINVHENLKEEEKVENYSTGKRFQVWRKDEEFMDFEDESNDSDICLQRRKGSEDIDNQITDEANLTQETLQIQKLKPIERNDNQNKSSDTQDDAKSTIRRELLQRFQMDIEDTSEIPRTYKKGTAADKGISEEIHINEELDDKSIQMDPIGGRLDEDDKASLENSSIHLKNADETQPSITVDENIQNSEKSNYSTHKTDATLANSSNSNSVSYGEIRESISQPNKHDSEHPPKDLGDKETSYDERDIFKNNSHSETTQGADREERVNEKAIMHIDTDIHLNKKNSNESVPSTFNDCYSAPTANKTSSASTAFEISNHIHPDTYETHTTNTKVLGSQLGETKINTFTNELTTMETKETTHVALYGLSVVQSDAEDSHQLVNNSETLTPEKTENDAIHEYSSAYYNDDDDDDDSVVMGGIAEHRDLNGTLNTSTSKIQQNKVKDMAFAFSDANKEADQSQYQDSNSNNQQNKVRGMASAFTENNKGAQNDRDQLETQNERGQVKNLTFASNGALGEDYSQQNEVENMTYSDISPNENQTGSTSTIPKFIFPEGEIMNQHHDIQSMASISSEKIDKQHSQANGFTLSDTNEETENQIDRAMNPVSYHDSIDPTYNTARNITFASATVVSEITTHSLKEDESGTKVCQEYEASPDTLDLPTEFYDQQTAYNTATPVFRETGARAQESQTFFNQPRVDRSIQDNSSDEEGEYYNQEAVYGNGEFGSKVTGQRARVERIHIAPNFLSAESVSNEYASSSSHMEYKDTVHVSNIEVAQGAIHIEHEVQASETAIIEDFEASNTNSKAFIKPVPIVTNQNEMFTSEEEDVAPTPTRENPYGKKETTKDDWNTSYDELMKSANEISFEDDEDDENENPRRLKKDQRSSFSSEKNETMILHTLSLENEARMFTIADVNDEKNSLPDFLSKPYTSDKEFVGPSEKRKSGSQRNHWSVGINLVEKVPVRQSVSMASEAGSEQWFDPENDWVEEKGYSNRSSMTTDSLKNSSTTENTTIDEEEEGLGRKGARELTMEEHVDPDLDYYSTALYTKKTKSYTSSNNEEAEGEILIFMQQDDQNNIQTKLEQNNNTTTTIVDREKVELEDQTEGELPITHQPRIEDISRYMNALPKTQEALIQEDAKQSVQAAAEKINIPNAHELTEHALSVEEVKQTKYGKIYIGVSGAHDVLLPLPKEITYARCVISDGEYEYMSRYEMLGEQILMDYECVIDAKPGMIITVSLHVRPDYHVKPRTGWTKWFTSIRKQKEHLSGYVHPEDGAIGQTRFAVDHMVPACFKKTYAANFDCFNSWYTRSSKERARREQFGDEEDFLKIVGKLNIEMLYLPVSGPSVQVPKSLRECDLTLKIRQWHDTCWQSGHLSTRVQGQKVWQRHYYRLLGSQLIGYTSEEEDREVWNHYNIADVIRLSAAADKVIVTLIDQEAKDEKVFGSESIVEENLKGFFRLSFADYHLDCVSDNVSESEEWVKTLKSMIGRVPLRLPFTDYY